jgi:hypothetical protein
MTLYLELSMVGFLPDAHTSITSGRDRRERRAIVWQLEDKARCVAVVWLDCLQI